MMLAATASSLGAVAAQAVGQLHAGRGAISMAQAAERRAEREALAEAAAGHAGQAGAWMLVGLGLAAVAVGCWAGSWWRGEPGRRWVPAVGLGVYVLIALILI